MRSVESRKAQTGAVVVLVAIAMGALILMAGLALDMGHAFLNKTRLQNAVDAAALAAAKVLDDRGDVTSATTEAITAFRNNASATGNRELSTAYGNGAGSIRVTVEYSQRLPPFTAGAPAGPYVRVRATGFVMPAWLVRVGGIFQKTVGATAVAGPRTLNAGSTVCNVAPMMVCGTPGGSGVWGYESNSAVVLKKAAPGGNSQIGPGNFNLIRINNDPGGAQVRENMAGSYDSCIASGSRIDTEPGNEAGPVPQGLNTRFGQYDGPLKDSSQYPPDVIVRAQSPALYAEETAQGYDVYQSKEKITASNISRLYNYQKYLNDLRDGRYDNSPTGGTAMRGAFNRRVLTVPVGDCSGIVKGAGSVPLLGFACFFLLQPVEQKGNESYVYGQLIDNCSASGTPGPNPVAGNGPHILQLYDDPDSNDS